MTMLATDLEAEAANRGDFRTALGRYVTGVTVVTTATDERGLEGLTVNSFSSLSLDPPLVLWSIRREAPSLNGFLASGAFAINVLAADQVWLSVRFATPRADKFSGVVFSAGHRGCPVLDGVIASFECDTHDILEGGDHLILVGRVRRVMHRDAPPLVYHAGRYATHVDLNKARLVTDASAPIV
jgi:flavin reductase (DIM6/NTAB) family NADH-FMN oxidoreductase RutF